MQNKLQELTEKLYNEGLSKGKKEAEDMILKAKREAEEIISKAKEEYNSILERAKKEAADFKVKSENELRMVSRQTLASVKQNIEEIIIAKVIEKPIKESVESKEFLSKIIELAIQSFNTSKGDSITLEVLLPEQKKEELDSFLKNSLIKELNAGVEFSYDKKIQNGFKIGPKGDGFHISFTDKDFQGLISQYLKPKTRQFLFTE